MKEPTEEQVKEFWEHYGLRWDGRKDAYCFIAPDGQPFSMAQMRDFESLGMLGILFKYAVPKVEHYKLCDTPPGQSGSPGKHTAQVSPKGEGTVTIGGNYLPFYDWKIARDEDPALALFRALWEVRKR